MRSLSHIVSNLIEVLESQNATPKQIKAATAEVIDGLNLRDDLELNVTCSTCDFTLLKSFPISYCKRCGYICPF